MALGQLKSVCRPQHSFVVCLSIHNSYALFHLSVQAFCGFRRKSVSVALRLENPGKYVSYHIDPAVPNCFFFFFKDRYETVLGHIRSLFDFYINLVAQHMKLSITFVFKF